MASPRKALITGATGFVGANLARRLLAEGHAVKVLIRAESQLWRLEELGDEIELINADLVDREAVEAAVKQVQPDWIFHLAAHGAYSWQTDRTQIISTNLLGTVNLVEACLKTDFEAFINTGSSSEYGYKDHAPSEDTFLEPNSDYAVAKGSATLFCRYIAQSQDVRINTLRLYSVYGPYEEPNRLLPTLIAYGLQGKLPSLVSPDTARDFIYSEDVNDAYLLATGGQPGSVYNVGSGKQTTIGELVTVAREVLDIEVQPEWGSAAQRSWDTSCWVSDPSRLRNELGWKPRYSLREGFVKMADWMRSFPGLTERYKVEAEAVS